MLERPPVLCHVRCRACRHLAVGSAHAVSRTTEKCLLPLTLPVEVKQACTIVHVAIVTSVISHHSGRCCLEQHQTAGRHRAQRAVACCRRKTTEAGIPEPHRWTVGVQTKSPRNCISTPHNTHENRTGSRIAISGHARLSAKAEHILAVYARLRMTGHWAAPPVLLGGGKCGPKLCSVFIPLTSGSLAPCSLQADSGGQHPRETLWFSFTFDPVSSLLTDCLLF